MLNISDNRITEEVKQEQYISFAEVLNPRPARVLTMWLVGLFILLVISMFMPWTQNIRARGKVTTLRPNQRPQTIVSTVAGRIESWYVNEGDTVRRGDTILYISEVKDKYFDPQLLDRTGQQIGAKKDAITAYDRKARALASQGENLSAAMKLKIEESRNKVYQSQFKVRADSIDWVAACLGDSIADIQLKRWETLFAQGLKSRTDLEKMRKQRQEAQAKAIAQQNKLATSRTTLINARIQLRNVQNEYLEKLNKVESDRQSTLSNRYDALAQVVKMENELTNLEMRQQYRYIIAPQTGIVNQALKSGIGEMVKEGDAVVSVVPIQVELAAEIFVRPVDLPLVRIGQPVRLEFDGWPAVIFGSGWPGAAFGTFAGEVFAIENNIRENGLYRILISSPEQGPEIWPNALRVGSGVNAFALLNDVPLGYEIWRQLNGFPPEYYTLKPKADDGAKKK